MTKQFGEFALDVYALLARGFGVFAPILLALRKQQGKEIDGRSEERLAKGMKVRPDGPIVWIHAASVGETNAILPLCQRLSERGCVVLITTVTATSAEIVRDRSQGNDQLMHQFAPFDVPSVIERFLNHWRPDLAVFVESEIWPCTIRALNARSAPVIIANARLSDRSFNRWKRLKFATPALFGRFDQIFARGEDDLLRFRALGAGKITIAGNLKYDAQRKPVGLRASSSLNSALGDRPVFLAASTHAGEERILIENHKQLSDEIPGLLTIIAPRHPHRGSAIVEEARQLGINASLRTVSETPDNSCEVFVADTLGELEMLYQIVPATFIGGSLVDLGGHNPIEAVNQDCAVLHGPHIGNFRDVYGTLAAAGGCVEIVSAERLCEMQRRCLNDPLFARDMVNRAQDVFANLGGASDIILQELEPILRKALDPPAEIVTHPSASTRDAV